MVDFLYLEGYILLILFVLIFKFINKYIGGADLLVFSFLVTRYGLYTSALCFFYASLFGLIFALVFRKDKIRFIPFILLGFIFYLKGGI